MDQPVVPTPVQPTPQTVPQVAPQVTPQIPPNNTAPKPANDWVKIIVICLVIVVLLAVAGYFILGKKSNKSANQAGSNVTTNGSSYLTVTPEDNGFATYTAKAEKLSFQYPKKWDVVAGGECLNPKTKESGECLSLFSPKAKNGQFIKLNYMWNDVAQEYKDTDKAIILEVHPLTVHNSKKQIYLVSFQEPTKNPQQTVVTLGLTDTAVTVGQKAFLMSTISQVDDKTFITMQADLLVFGAEVAPYTLEELKSFPEYNDAVKIFESLSY